MSKNIGRHNMIVERVSISNIDNMEEYDFFEKEILIGSGYINYNIKMNNIYIFVKPEFRSQGFGCYITKHMIELLCNNNIKQVTISLERENTHACNMVEKFGAINVSNLEGFAKYILPINTKNVE
jgi:GNAT superfamily N-acetyltransferase